MKIRNGYVSNSSSSSFVLKKENLTDYQIYSIKNHIEEAEKHCDFYNFGCIHSDDGWSITEHEFYIHGYCFMDNFDMYTFIHDYLKIPKTEIKWEY